MTDLVQAQDALFETRYEVNPNGPPSVFTRVIEARKDSDGSSAVVPTDRRAPIEVRKGSKSGKTDVDQAVQEAYAACDQDDGEVLLIDLDRVFRQRYPNVAFLEEGYTSLHDYFTKSSGFSVVESGSLINTKVRKISRVNTKRESGLPLTVIRNSFDKAALGRQAISIDELSHALTTTSFQALDYGYGSLIELLKENSDLFDVFSDKDGKVRVRLRYC